MNKNMIPFTLFFRNSMKYRESILSMNKNEQTLGNKNYSPKNPFEKSTDKMNL